MRPATTTARHPAARTRAWLIMLASGLLVAAAGLGQARAAGQVSIDAQKDTVWQAGVDGVEIEWGADGSLNRIYSAFYQPVGIADRRGVSKAQVIAEEKAKAAIVRFMSQGSSTERLVTQVDSDLEEATQRQGGAAAGFSKLNQRKMVEELRETTRSFASGRLRGVIVLEKGFDEAKGEAWVKVGMSRKTMAAAQGLAVAIDEDRRVGAAGPGRAASAADPRLLGSELRKSNQKDW